MIELTQNNKETFPVRLFYATQERLIFNLAQGETGGIYKLSIRARLDPNTASMCDSSGIETGGKVTFELNTFTQEFKRVCDTANVPDASAGCSRVWLEIYDTQSSRVLLQRQIDIAYRAATLTGQPSAPVESYLKAPAGGTTGQVLKKTATGTEWANEQSSSGTGQLQSDWNQSDNTQKDFIKNKPEIPVAQVQSDWNQSDNTQKDFIKNKPLIPAGNTVGACTGLGKVVGDQTITLTWVDPDDVLVGTAEIALWNRTVLIRKQNGYPQAYNDGTQIAYTDRTEGTKSQYQTNGYIDTLPEGTWYYALFSQSDSGAWNKLAANYYPRGTTTYNWGQIQAFVRAGTAPTLFPVGTVFAVDHAEYLHRDGTGIYFRVMGYDQVPAKNEALTHTMCLKMTETLFIVPADESESTYALTNDTTAQAGKSYYSLSGSTYTKLVEGTDYEVGDPVPAASWYEKNIDGHNRGSNNPVQNNLVQWANKNGAPNQWFTKQTIWDTCSSTLAAKSGFLRHIDPLFLAVVQEAKLTTARCNAEGGGDVTHSAKFWPLSITQVYGSCNNGVSENIRLKYFTDGGSAVCNIMDSSTASTWWLRSPGTSNAHYVCYVQASGASSVSYAYSTFGVSLACIIA